MNTLFRASCLALLLATPILCKAGGSDAAATETSGTLGSANAPRVAGDQEIIAALKNHGAKVLVVNFWATWCPPCVEELPWFIETSRAYDASKVRFLGISSDFTEDLQTKVIPFVQKKGIPYPILVMDVDPEKFIPGFAKEWSGALPATFYYSDKGEKLGQRLTPVSKEQLRGDIEALLAGNKLP